MYFKRRNQNDLKKRRYSCSRLSVQVTLLSSITRPCGDNGINRIWNLEAERKKTPDEGLSVSLTIKKKKKNLFMKIIQINVSASGKIFLCISREKY